MLIVGRVLGDASSWKGVKGDMVGIDCIQYNVALIQNLNIQIIISYSVD